MLKIIHLETKLQAVFGVLDDDGNVVSRHPVNIEVPKHDDKLFLEALSVLQKSRADLAEQLKNAELKQEEPVVTPEQV